MQEVPLFFRNGSHNLFGVLHEAPGSPTRGFVFCHPFGEEKLWAHRVFVSFARELAGRGFPVLRFDYMGSGDSDGSFHESSVSTALADIERAVDHLKERTGVHAVDLLGLRFGGALAATAADRRSDVKRLLLWAPIVDGARYMQELLRINVTTQMAVYKEVRVDRAAMIEAMKAGHTVNVDGYEVSWPMYAELSALNLQRPSAFAGPCLIAQIERAPNAKPNAELQQLQQQYPGGSHVVVQEDPFWKEIDRFYERAPNLFAGTLDWLEQHQ